MVFRKNSSAGLSCVMLTLMLALSPAVVGLQRARAETAHTDSNEQHASHHTSGGHDGAAGVPISFERDLALWSLIVFVVFLFVLKKTAWGPLIAALDQRESGIRAAIAEAEENQRKSQALLAEYEDRLRDAERTVAAMMAEAKSDAERTGQEIVAKAQAEVEAMKARAKDEIEQARDAALMQLFDAVHSRIALATERVLGRAVSGEDQERLIEEALSEIGS